MKILLIGHECEVNGASRSLLNIADELIRRGHAVYVLTAFGQGAFYDALRKRSIELIVHPYFRWSERRFPIYKYIWQSMKWMLKNRGKSINTAREMAKFVEKEEIDIVHSNTSVINIGGLISKYSGVPHVWHIREFGDIDFDMYPLIPRLWYYDFMNRYSDCFICISKAIYNHYKALDSKKKKIIYNGIDAKAVIPLQKKNKKVVTLLIAGMLHEAKGQDEAVQACAELIKRGIRCFELLIAGAGEVYFSIPEEVADYVRLLGRVENMPELRSNVDIELVCSRAEAFGRVTAEAMLGGIPVIGSNRGGTPELIQNGITGFLYERGNTMQLADRLETLINNAELRTKMGIAAQKYALDHFTIKRCVDQIEEVYKELKKK